MHLDVGSLYYRPGYVFSYRLRYIEGRYLDQSEAFDISSLVREYGVRSPCDAYLFFYGNSNSERAKPKKSNCHHTTCTEMAKTIKALIIRFLFLDKISRRKTSGSNFSSTWHSTPMRSWSISLIIVLVIHNFEWVKVMHSCLILDQYFQILMIKHSFNSQRTVI